MPAAVARAPEQRPIEQLTYDGEPSPVSLEPFEGYVDEFGGIQLANGSTPFTIPEGAEENATGIRWRDATGENVLYFGKALVPDGGQCDLKDCVALEFLALQYRLVGKTWRPVIVSTEAYDKEPGHCTELDFELETGDWSLTDVDDDGIAETLFVVRLGCRNPSHFRVSIHLSEDGKGIFTSEALDGSLRGRTPPPLSHEAHLRSFWEKTSLHK